jgi:hypothetical protein
MAPQLAKAGGRRREMLIDQAACAVAGDRATLPARDGTIRREGTVRTLPYGELTKGQALSGTIPATPAIDSRDKWQLRGTADKKVDGRDFFRHRPGTSTRPDIAAPRHALRPDRPSRGLRRDAGQRGRMRRRAR